MVETDPYEAEWGEIRTGRIIVVAGKKIYPVHGCKRLIGDVVGEMWNHEIPRKIINWMLEKIFIRS